MIENPFPGMNPYLEQRWGDVHAALITYCRDLLQGSLPDSLRARMQERVFVEAEPGQPRTIFPDVQVYERPNSDSGSATGGAAVAEPLVIHLPKWEVRESYLEIIDARSGGRVITIIEFLSPSNKMHGPGRTLYLEKQADAQDGGVNLVEVDLLRGGKPTTLARPDLVRPENWAQYHVSAWRAENPFKLEYYPSPLRQSLPSIKIPLRPTDADVKINLQELINLCYTRGRYDDIDYSVPLQPTLASDDQAWVKGVLEKRRPAST